MALPKETAHAPFLTQMTVLVGNLGFQSMTNHYERPCNTIIWVHTAKPFRKNVSLHCEKVNK